jgi:anti-anti-sigma regulatory factor
MWRRGGHSGEFGKAWPLGMPTGQKGASRQEQDVTAALRRWHPRTRVISFHLGRTSLTALSAAVTDMLADPAISVVVEVNGFDYFDETELTKLVDLVAAEPRLSLHGLEQYADRLIADAPGTIDVRSRAERAVLHLSSVTVVTGIVDGHPLDDSTWQEALCIAFDAGRPMVTVDLRALAALSVGQVLALAELSADLHRAGRQFLLVNVGHEVAAQIRQAGLSGAHMTENDFS